MRIRVQQPGSGRAGEQQPDQHQACPVSLLLRAVGDDLCEGGAVHPFADQHVIGSHNCRRHVDVRVVGECDGEGVLRRGLKLVVEFFGHTSAQFVEQRPDVQPRHQDSEQPGDASELSEVADQRLPGARVLDLDRDLAPVVPDGLMNLADRGRGCGLVAELGELVPPVPAKISCEHLVHRAGGKRRRSFLKSGQGGPVWPGQLWRKRGFEDR